MPGFLHCAMPADEVAKERSRAWRAAEHAQDIAIIRPPMAGSETRRPG